jgi:hypothetical protein
MRFSTSRGHPTFDLDGGLAKGVTTVIKASREPVQPPTDPAYVLIIESCLCRVKMGQDCYVVTGITGDERTIPYGASFETWVRTCKALLEIAIKADMV